MLTRSCSASTTRAKSAVNATCRSPVSAWRRVIAAEVIWRLSTEHCTPAGSRIWPSVIELLKPRPAASGPLQSRWSRVQSQTQAAAFLSGSSPRAPQFAQPHDQIVAIARGAIADEIRRARIEATLSVRRPTPVEISSFYFAYPSLLSRSVSVTPAAWWLGGEREGVALSSIAPARVFSLERKGTVHTLDGRFVVRPLAKSMPLGALPLERARPGIVAALEAFARGAAYERWSAAKQDSARKRALCARDDLPSAGAVDLSTFLPFLSLTG